MARSTLSLLYVLTCLAIALAASIPRTDYEVIVVGGGPAGLSALSGLSRVRRKTVLFDSGEYRNAPTREMHDVIGNDGTPPSQFRNEARKQISKYNTATIVDTTIDSISVNNGSGVTNFVATDKSGTQYIARKLVLGTGMKDLIPQTPGLQDAWGKGVYWCPWCDGYEHRDQPFGLLCPLNKVVPNIREMSTLNSDIVAFVNGTQTPEEEQQLDSSDPAWREEIAAYNVTIDNRVIASFERLQDGGEHQDQGGQFDKFRLHFTDGSTAERNAFIASFSAVQHSRLPVEMGLGITDDGNNKIKTDINKMTTNIPGVFAVGDANSDGTTNVPHSMFSGKRAAVYIHGELAREEMKAAISKRRPLPEDMDHEAIEKRMGDDLEAIWDRIRRD